MSCREEPIGTPIRAAAPVAAPPVHVQMFAPDDPEAKCSIYVEMTREEGRIVLRLLHAYPDLRPEVGWRVVGRDLELAITAVDGRDLTCEVTDG